MSYQVLIDVDFGSGNSGITPNGKLFDAVTGAQVGTTKTTGFVAIAGFGGKWAYLLDAPDGHLGPFVVYDASNTALRRSVAIAPRETENSDAKTSTIPNTAAIVAAIKATAIMTGVSLEDVLRNLWSATVGDSDGDDPDDPGTVTYKDATGAVDVTHALTDTSRRVTTA